MEMKQIALRYYENGLCILPLHNYKKNPPFPWEKYKTERPTKQQVEDWFSSDKVTGIVLVCGQVSGVTVVDDDDYKKGNPLDLNSPLEASTASGGRHIYFNYSPEVQNKNIHNQEHDFEVQNDGKLIVMPPSKAKNKHGEIGNYKWSVTDQPKTKLLPKLGADFTAKYVLDQKTTIPTTELFEVEIGAQHNALRTLTNKLLFQTPESDWDTIKLYMYKTAKGYNPPHSTERIKKMWLSCTKFVKQKKLEKVQPKPLSQVNRDRLIEREFEKNAPSTGYTSLDKYIRGFVPGRLYVVTGDTNVGKTSICANFTHNLASVGKKVLYFSLEPGNTIVDYLETIEQEKTFFEDRKPYNNENVLVYTNDVIDSLEKMIGAVKQLPRQDLIIVDHIGYFTSDKNNSVYQAQSDAVKQLVQLAKTKKTAILLIAHTRKDYKGDYPSMNDISGSASFKQDATDVLIFSRDKSEIDKHQVEFLDTGVILIAKTKAGPQGIVKIKFKERSAKIYERQEFKPAF